MFAQVRFQACMHAQTKGVVRSFIMFHMSDYLMHMCTAEDAINLFMHYLIAASYRPDKVVKMDE